MYEDDTSTGTCTSIGVLVRVYQYCMYCCKTTNHNWYGRVLTNECSSTVRTSVAVRVIRTVQSYDNISTGIDEIEQLLDSIGKFKASEE